jgi:hypothetical protein
MGNFGCNCSSALKEETVLDSHLSSDLEEVVEFQPEVYKTITLNPCQVLPDSKMSTIPTDTLSPEIQGELFRLQKSSKEILVPRWCVLCNRSLKYFKNQYSAHCKEKPLFEIPTAKVLGGRAYRKTGRFCLEILFYKESISIGALCEPVKSFSELGSKKDSRNSSFSSVKLPKLPFANEIETLIFIAGDRSDWEKWSKGLLSCIKNNINNLH